MILQKETIRIKRGSYELIPIQDPDCSFISTTDTIEEDHLYECNFEGKVYSAPNLTTIKGELTLDESCVLYAPNLTDASDLYIMGGAVLVAPKLKRVGRLNLNRCQDFDMMNIECVGKLSIRETITKSDILREVGELYIHNSTIELPNLVKCNGIESKYATLSIPKLEILTGGMYITSIGRDKIQAPELRMICGNCDMTAYMNFPKLSIITGGLKIHGVYYTKEIFTSNITMICGILWVRNTSITFPDLNTVGGYVILHGGYITIPKLKEITGTLTASGAVECSLPEVTEIHGHVNISAMSEVSLNKLKRICGHLTCPSDKFMCDELHTVCGNISKLPKIPKSLRSINSYVDIDLFKYLSDSDISARYNLVITNENPSSDAIYYEPGKRKIRVSNNLISVGRGIIHIGDDMVVADGLVTKVIHRRGDIYEVISIKTNVKCYLVEQNRLCAHGSTVREAFESLRFKEIMSDLDKYKNYKKNQRLTTSEAINCYRSITGACKFGVDQFLEKFKRKTQNVEEFTIDDIAKYTDGEYGNTVFRQFFDLK